VEKLGFAPYNSVMETARWLLLYLIGALCLFSQQPGELRETGHMNFRRSHHAATLLNDGTVLITGGGCLGEGPSCGREAETYDPATGQFTPTAPMLRSRVTHTATLLADGRVLIAGGGGVDHSPEIYDPSTRSFSLVSNDPQARNWAYYDAILLADGKVLLSGVGQDIFDPAKMTFHSIENSGTQSYAWTRSVRLPNGHVLMSGGHSLTNTGLGPFHATYNPSSQQFTIHPYPSRGIGLMDHTLSLLSDGSGLTIGGTWYSYAENPSAQIDIFDYRSTSAGRLGVLTTPRSLHQATRLPDNSVLVSGGETPFDRGTDTTEIYDSQLIRSVAGPRMNVKRAYHTSTLLKDGTVLIAGGYTPSCTTYSICASNAAELYIPPNPIPAPKLHTLPDGGAAILHAGTARLVTPADPALPGEVLEIYLSGLEADNVNPPLVAVGNTFAELLYWGPIPGHPGQYQINIRVPSDLKPSSATRVQLNYLDRPSNAVTIAISH
jgi:hypothetical protein